jgi:quinol monooxygenase YgiN
LASYLPVVTKPTSKIEIGFPRSIPSSQPTEKKELPMPISVFATITPKPKHRSDAIAAVKEIIGDTRAEAGCTSFELHEGVETGQLYLYEVWEDRSAFDAHHARPYTKAVYERYEAWLAAPVELIFMQPVD